MRVVSVVGARPNFVKIAAVAAAFRARADQADHTIVHTGQHYDAQLSRVFFDELGIPQPDRDLHVGSGAPGDQTSSIVAAVVPVLKELAPDIVIVVGDVNSTVAAARAADRIGIPVAHVEAGLRSFDWSMPEEANRVTTDRLARWLFTTEASADANLAREGIPAERVHFVGNVMIDTLLAHRARAIALNVAGRYGLERREYGVLTLHRPGNVDDPASLSRLFEAIGEIARSLPMVFPVHPRTRPVLAADPQVASLAHAGRIRIVEPLGYGEFIGLLEGSRLTLTDSGGVQEETTMLGVPCLTLRDNTERPVTVTYGTNRIAGTNPAGILAAWRDLQRSPPTGRVPPLWDGRAAERIVNRLIGVRPPGGR